MGARLPKNKVQDQNLQLICAEQLQRFASRWYVLIVRFMQEDIRAFRFKGGLGVKAIVLWRRGADRRTRVSRRHPQPPKPAAAHTR